MTPEEKARAFIAEFEDEKHPDLVDTMCARIEVIVPKLATLLREVDASARAEAFRESAAGNLVTCARCSKKPHWKDAIRCAECKGYFCEAPCLMEHFASSGDDFKLGGLRAQRHYESVRSWMEENERLRRVLLRISNAHIIKTMGGDIVDAEVTEWAGDALCEPAIERLSTEPARNPSPPKEPA